MSSNRWALPGAMRSRRGRGSPWQAQPTQSQCQLTQVRDRRHGDGERRRLRPPRRHTEIGPPFYPSQLLGRGREGLPIR